MSVEVIHFDQWTIGQVQRVYSDHNIKARAYRGVKYVQENPGTVAKKTAKISIPIILVAGVGGAVAGFAVGGAVGAPVGAGIGTGIAVGVAIGSVVAVRASIVHISHSSHYKAWKESKVDQHMEGIFDRYEQLLEQDSVEIESIRDPISQQIIRLPVKGPDGVVYDFSSITNWIRTKPTGTPASVYRTCDFSIEQLEFDFPAAENIIRVIEAYRENHEGDANREILVAALHLIERDLYERICSLWGAEIGRLQDNLSSGAISAVEFASCIDRLRNIYRLDQLGQLLANNPLIERDINELLATIRPVSSTNASEPANSGGQESRVEGDKV